MANRFWVGNSGNFLDSAHWSLTSGGAGGAAVPTNADSVFFDANSFSIAGQTVTVDSAAATCLDMTWTGAANNPTLAVANAIAICGSLTLIAAMSVSGSAKVTLSDPVTSGAANVTTAGKTLPKVAFGSGANSSKTWTLQDNLSSNSTVTVAGGTLAVNGKTINCVDLFSILNNGSTVMGSGTLNVNVTGATGTGSPGIFFNLSTGSFSAGTSTVNITGLPALVSCTNGTAFNNLTLSCSGAATLSVGGSVGSLSFANLTRNGTATKTDTLELDNIDITVSGTFTAAGNSVLNRLLVWPPVRTRRSSITAAAVAISNADFRGIAGLGAASWNLSAITGGSGDCGDNNGLTFTAATTRYWVGKAASGTWSDSSKWSAASNGAGGATVPLPQDTVVFNPSSVTAAGLTITADMPRLGRDVSFTGMLNSPTLSFSSLPTVILGSLTLIAGMALSGTQGLSLWSWPTVTSTLTSAGRTFTCPVTADARGTSLGTVLLGDAFLSTYNGVGLVIYGGFIASNLAVTAKAVRVAAGSLSMGSGLWTLTGNGTVWDATSASGVAGGTSTLKLTDSSSSAKTMESAPSSNAATSSTSFSYNTVWFSGTGTGVFNLNGSAVYAGITVDPGLTLSLQFGKTTKTTTASLSGTAGKLVTLKSSLSGFQATVLKAGGGTLVFDYMAIMDSFASPGSTWYAGANSTDSGDNTQWNFGLPSSGGNPLFFGSPLN